MVRASVMVRGVVRYAGVRKLESGVTIPYLQVEVQRPNGPIEIVRVNMASDSAPVELNKPATISCEAKASVYNGRAYLNLDYGRVV